MFFEDVPITAIAICYGPLLITVLGFIVFAALTDADARRTYLRRLGKTSAVDRPILAETPAGAEVLIRPRRPATPAVEAPKAAAKVGSGEAEMVAEAPAPAVPAVEDDLKLIVGIGPKIEEALKASGITTFAQIANMTSEELTHIVKDEHNVRMVGDGETWVKQAQFLVAGDVEGLQAYQDSLSGGQETE
jgi:predicted flap endonuclease-1-like 5' DNA nuclease